MYSLADYGAMIADEVRMAAFVEALRRAVRPGAVVADIGAGTGIFALLACRLGARRVYAIEPDDAIQVAREVAAANGLAGRIEFFQALSTDITLPEPADVIVADIGGVLPWFGRHIPAMIDARTRLLKPGGVLIPRRDVIWAAVVEAPDVYARFAGPWDRAVCGLDMTAVQRVATNTWNQARLTREHALTEAQRFAAVDYAFVDDADLHATIEWTVARDGTAHGFGAGIDRTVGDGAVVSNAPDASPSMRPDRIYGTVFFPWQEPVAVARGDRVIVRLDARLMGDDYVWTWHTQVLDGTGPARAKAVFAQSTFLGIGLSRESLRRKSDAYTPALNDEGQVARFVLDAMAGGSTLGEIAARVAERFPARFPRWESALGYVGELSCRYG